ncbi:MAG TPA: ATP-dependent DNA helicase RecG [Ktedonobacterales bacterium]
MAQPSRTTGHSPSGAQSLIDRARRVLAHEQRTSHGDTAVKPGGLEAFITRWASDVRAARLGGAIAAGTSHASGPAPEEAIARLLGGYHALDPMSRAAKVRAALALLDTIKAAPSPRPPGAAAPTVRSAPHTSPASRTPDRPASSPTPRATRPAPAMRGAIPTRGQPDDWPLAKPMPPLPTLATKREDAPRPAPKPEDEYLLQAPVTAVPGVGPTQQERLRRLGIETVRDLLFAFPREHLDYSKLAKIGTLPFDETVTILGTLWEIETKRTGGGRTRTIARVSDETGAIRLQWFNQPYLQKQLPRGGSIVATGVKQRFGNSVTFAVKSHELPEQGDLINTGRLVPVYPLTEGLYPKTLRRYTKWAVDRCAAFIPEHLPPALRARARLLPLPDAVAQMHYPDGERDLADARRRLAFDELFLIQMGMLTRRANWQEGPPAPPLPVDEALIFAGIEAGRPPDAPTESSGSPSPHAVVARPTAPLLGPGSEDPASASASSASSASSTVILSPTSASSAVSPSASTALGGGLWGLTASCFEETLPFRFTGAQRRAIREILKRLRSTTPMSLLLQGDVGSGKTVVAAAALLAAAANGYQGALLAPTEILAEQHYRGLAELLAPFGLKVVLLTGSQRAKERQAALAALASGEAAIAIGTHALLQEGVEFKRLALAIVDEQHRFGVEQREALRQKGYSPHMLVMTATPIPRTLALTLYGDLDVALLDELPAGRLPIVTRWRSGSQRAEAYRLVAEEVAAGRQAYVICPLVEESEALEAKSAVKEYERLRREVFPDLRLGLVHGQVKPAEKDRVMRAFRDGEIDVLVATAVVEVGVDVPNATVMLIEDADRFGLSQLHQFRGRVGRGAQQSYCYLLSQEASMVARERLAVMERTTDGFALAEADLQLRGPGDFFGTRQSGLPELKVAKLADAPLLTEAREQAEWLWAQDPYLRKLEHAALRERVFVFWREFMAH